MKVSTNVKFAIMLIFGLGAFIATVAMSGSSVAPFIVIAAVGCGVVLWKTLKTND